MNAELDLATLVTTRRALHGVAELVMAGPQYRSSQTVRLHIMPGGFGTITTPRLRVKGVELLAGDRRLPLNGTTYAGLAEAAGVRPGPPEGLYKGGSRLLGDDPIMVDSAAAAMLAYAFERGDEALRELTLGAAPTLWPEHFDLAASLDEITYGVSPGDDYIPDPYAYANPERRRHGDFWNAPFGAARPLRLLTGPTAIYDFFMEATAHAN